MKILNQKYNRHSKTFEIVEDGVFVIEKTSNTNNEYKVHFEDIGTEEFILNKKKDSAITILLLSLLFNAIFSCYIIFQEFEIPDKYLLLILNACLVPFYIVIVIYWSEFKNESIKVLKSKNPINFFYREKERKEVNDFITLIKESKKQFFINQYYKVDNLIPIDVQKHRIHWLYENKYISESDAKFILDELESKRIIEGK